MKVKRIKRKLIRFLRRGDVRGALESLLIIGVLYFGVSGAMMLALRTDSPMMAVESDSMKHVGDGEWREFFENRGIDSFGFPIQGGFEKGDMLLLQGISSPRNVIVGDVIVYQKEPKPIAHRVIQVKIEGEMVWYVTKGDNPITNPKPDELEVEPGQVIGKVVLVIPKLGYLTLYPLVSWTLIVLLFFAVWVTRRG